MPNMRRFTGINLISNRIPDETTILRFSHLLEKHNMVKAIFEVVKAHLRESVCVCMRDMTMRRGIIKDTTMIAAPSPTKRKSGKRDPEMHRPKKGKHWYIDMNTHAIFEKTPA